MVITIRNNKTYFQIYIIVNIFLSRIIVMNKYCWNVEVTIYCITLPIKSLNNVGFGVATKQWQLLLKSLINNIIFG